MVMVIVIVIVIIVFNQHNYLTVVVVVDIVVVIFFAVCSSIIFTSSCGYCDFQPCHCVVMIVGIGIALFSVNVVMIVGMVWAANSRPIVKICRSVMLCSCAFAFGFVD